MAVSTACLGDDRPAVGAIRWDAWTGGGVTEQVERTLGPEKYHDRLPWFAKVIDAETVTIDGGPQKVMDKEIEFAVSAGLDYWAFLVYPEASPMSTALKQYLASREREQIRFCLILHSTLKAKAERWPGERGAGILAECRQVERAVHTTCYHRLGQAPPQGQPGILGERPRLSSAEGVPGQGSADRNRPASAKRPGIRAETPGDLPGQCCYRLRLE